MEKKKEKAKLESEVEEIIQEYWKQPLENKTIVKAYQALQGKCQDLVEGKLFFNDFKNIWHKAFSPTEIIKYIQINLDSKKRIEKGSARYKRRKQDYDYRGRKLDDEWQHLKFTSDLFRWTKNTNKFDNSVRRSLGFSIEEFTTVLSIALRAWFFYFMEYSKEKPNIPLIIEQTIDEFYKTKRISKNKVYIAYEMLKTVIYLINTCLSFFYQLNKNNSTKVKRYFVYFAGEQAYLILGSEWNKYKGNYFDDKVIRRQIKEVVDRLHYKDIGLNTKNKVSGQFYKRHRTVYTANLASSIIFGLVFMGKATQICKDIFEYESKTQKIQEILDNTKPHLKTLMLRKTLANNFPE